MAVPAPIRRRPRVRRSRDLLGVSVLALLLLWPVLASADVLHVYDRLNRLRATVDSAGNTAAIWSYDSVGNITAITRQPATQTTILEIPAGAVAGACGARILGVGFSTTPGENAVTINGVAATVQSATPTELVICVAVGTTTGAVAVTTPTGSDTSATPLPVQTTAAVPTITTFTPGVAVWGTALSVTGASFDPVSGRTSVRMGATSLLASVSTGTDTSLSATVPPGTTSGRVSVITPGGTATALADLFIPPGAVRGERRRCHGAIDTYDAASRRATMTVAGQAAVSYTFDTADRLIQVAQGSQTVGLTYDDANRRSTLTLPNGVVLTYVFDTADRLTSLTYALGGTTLGALNYTPDAAGNRTAVGGAWARTNLPAAVGSASYNANHQQLTFGDATMTYDLNGNLATLADASGTTTYTWNPRNQLTGLSGPGLTASFGYDALGRRWTKTVNSAQTDYLYDGLNPIQEGALPGTPTATLLTGLGLDEFFARTDAAGLRALLPDALGSTVALSDSAGAVPTAYTYAPFGDTTVTGTASSNPYQFTGRENDGTGLYYYRARYYHPGLHRFVSEDPLEYAGGDVNLYSYVWNGPTSWRDPLGLCPMCIVAVPVLAPAAAQAVAVATAVIVGAAVGGVISDAIRSEATTADVFPDPANPPPDWIPLGPGRWKDPPTGEVWRWHKNPKPGEGPPHWDIGGPKPGRGQKGKQEWWPLGGKRGPKPPGGKRPGSFGGVPAIGCRKC